MAICWASTMSQLEVSAKVVSIHKRYCHLMLEPPHETPKQHPPPPLLLAPQHLLFPDHPKSNCQIIKFAWVSAVAVPVDGFLMFPARDCLAQTDSRYA